MAKSRWVTKMSDKQFNSISFCLVIYVFIVKKGFIYVILLVRQLKRLW